MKNDGDGNRDETSTDTSARSYGVSHSTALAPFVGRQIELAVLESALDRAKSARGGIVVVAGEAGIGKTRLTQEISRRVGSECGVHFGRWLEGHALPAYWIWAEVIRSFIRGRDPADLVGQMGSGVSDIVRIVPEIQHILPTVEPLTDIESVEAQFRLLNSIRTFLFRASHSRTQLIILDNLNLADKPSLLLLEFLAEEIASKRLLIVATYRTGKLSVDDALAQTLGVLAKEPLFGRIFLTGFGAEEIHNLILRSLEIDPPRAFIDQIVERTGGNCLFVTEIIRFMGKQEKELWGHSIPEAIRFAISRRLSQLSKECLEILTVAAVIGRIFRLDRLQVVLPDRPMESLIDCIEEALAAPFIEDVPGSAGWYRFTHALVREAVAGQLSLARRSILHERIGKALELLYASQAEYNATELAHHFVSANSVEASAKAAHYSKLAGDAALRAYAHEEALEHYRRSLDARPDSAIDDEKAELLAGMARAYAFMRNRTEADEVLRRAIEYYAKTMQLSSIVEILELHFLPDLVGPYTHDFCERTLKLVKKGSIEEARVLSLHSRHQAHKTGNYEEARGNLERILTIARAEGNEKLEMRAFTERTLLDFQWTLFAGFVAKSDRAIGLAEKVDDSYTAACIRQYAGFYWANFGHPKVARKHASIQERLADEVRSPNRLVEAIHLNHAVHQYQGEWDEARHCIHRGLEIQANDIYLLANLSVLEYGLGKFADGKARIEQLCVLVRESQNDIIAILVAIAIPLAAQISGDRSLLAFAENAAQTVLQRIKVPYLRIGAKLSLGLIAALTEDAGAAATLYDDLYDPESNYVFPWGCFAVFRVLGNLCNVSKNVESGITCFTKSYELCKGAGYYPELAWTCLEYSALLLEHGDFDRGCKAESLLKEGLKIATDLGMKPLRDLTGEALTRLAQKVAPLRPSGLTRREIDVLRLLAQGKTNQGIGHELFISENTVINHVSIFKKIKTANRTEAAIFAARNNLLKEPRVPNSGS